MPNQPATPNRAVRIDDDTWQQLGDAAAAADTDRSAILRQLVQWWLRLPGARMPSRPEHTPGTHRDGNGPDSTGTGEN